jgi:hypothetical protein
VYGTDPDVADSDGDGYNDGKEVFVGTSPTAATSGFTYFLHDISKQTSLFISGLITAFLGLFTGTATSASRPGRSWWQFW